MPNPKENRIKVSCISGEKMEGFGLLLQKFISVESIDGNRLII